VLLSIDCTLSNVSKFYKIWSFIYLFFFQKSYIFNDAYRFLCFSLNFILDVWVFCVLISLDMAYFYKYQDLRCVFGGCEYN